MGLNLVHLFGHLSWPVIPTVARTIHEAIMPAPSIIAWPGQPMAEFLDQLDPGAPIQAPDVLFAKITDEQISSWKERFGGDDTA
jgi:methionyl-tRNA synthetase